MADADADIAAVDKPPTDGASNAPATEQGDSGGEAEPAAGDAPDAALEGGYSAATLAELCRFFYDQPRLAELTDVQAAEMAARLRLARGQGVTEDKLAGVARKGLAMGDLPRARRAADLLLTFHAGDEPAERRAA